MVGVLVGALVGPLLGSGEGVSDSSVTDEGSGPGFFEGNGGFDASAAAAVSAVGVVWLIRPVSAFAVISVVCDGAIVWLLYPDVVSDG